MKHSEVLSSLREIESKTTPSFFMRLKIEKFYNTLLNHHKYKHKHKHLKFYKKIAILLIHIYLSVLSVINIIRFFIFKNKTVGHFLISIDNNELPYDSRSMFILDFLKPTDSINFFHNGNILYTFKNSFKVKNAIYFQSLVYLMCLSLSRRFISLESQWERLGKEAEIEMKLLLFILKLVSIKKFLFIDDTRNCLTALAACKELKIETTAYQHARFNEYHLGLMEFKFNKYLCWNSYFKDKLLEMNPNYKTNDILICNHPRYRPSDKEVIKKTRNVIVLEENDFRFVQAKPYLDKISEDIRIIYRLKPGLKAESIVNNQKIVFSSDSSIEKDILDYSPFALIGSESTLLLESWLFNVPSIGLKGASEYGLHLERDGLVQYCYKFEDLNSMLEDIYDLSPEKILERRKKVWGSHLSENTYHKFLQENGFLAGP